MRAAATALESSSGGNALFVELSAMVATVATGLLFKSAK
jgi:hypothetical protein